MRLRALSVSCLALLSVCVLAGPNQDELSRYRCIVPDWSKTSGGASPAVSPDGDTLAYLSNGKVWIVSGLNAYDPASKDPRGKAMPPRPWQLDVKIPDSAFRPAFIIVGNEGFRSIDWSRDGKRLAFVFEGRLFVAENLDPNAKTADIRLLADPTRVPDEDLKRKHASNPHMDLSLNREGVPVKSPRWSPDGKRIAFLRSPADFTSAWNVSVLDLAAGKEKVVAADALNDTMVWGQPWSPDGKSLVYATITPMKDGKSWTRGGIKIVSVDQGKPRKLVDQPECYYPSWSPEGNRIAYVASGEGPGVEAMFPVLSITDDQGAKPTQVLKTAPSKSDKARAMAEMRSRLQKTLKEQYTGVYNAAQLERFMREDVTDNEVIGIIMVAEAVSEAKAIGGEFQQCVEAAMAEFNARGKPFILERHLPAPAASDAIQALPEEQKIRIQGELSGTLAQVSQPLLRLTADVDSSPAWSPDARYVAFVRWNVVAGQMRLMTVDPSTGESRILFEENKIEHPQWVKSGRSLVVQSSRNLAYKWTDDNPKGLFEMFYTMPSYPEIWILDLK